jgi:hypothetical protein
MPYCHASVIPPVIQYLRERRPTRILACGCGWGQFGFLFRMHAEIMQGGTFHAPQTWKCTIVGVEVHQPYLIPGIHGYVYDHVYVGELLDMARRCLLPRAQFIYLGDVLEHFSDQDGETILTDLFRLTDGCLVVSTPIKPSAQGAEYGNEYERHRSKWDLQDLQHIAHGQGGSARMLAAGPLCFTASLEK